MGLFVFVLGVGHLWLAITNLGKLRRLNPMYSGPLKGIQASQLGYIAGSFLFLSIGLAIVASATQSVFLLYVEVVMLPLSLLFTGIAMAYDYRTHKKKLKRR
jgi:hypothetical protein